MGQAVLQVLGISNEQADTNSSGNSLFYFPDMCGQVLSTNIHFPLCFPSAFNIRGTSVESYFFWRLGVYSFEVAGPTMRQFENQWAWEVFLCIYFALLYSLHTWYCLYRMKQKSRTSGRLWLLAYLRVKLSNLVVFQNREVRRNNCQSWTEIIKLWICFNNYKRLISIIIL